MTEDNSRIVAEGIVNISSWILLYSPLVIALLKHSWVIGITWIFTMFSSFFRIKFIEKYV